MKIQFDLSAKISKLKIFEDIRIYDRLLFQYEIIFFNDQDLKYHFLRFLGFLEDDID